MNARNPNSRLGARRHAMRLPRAVVISLVVALAGACGSAHSTTSPKVGPVGPVGPVGSHTLPTVATTTTTTRPGSPPHPSRWHKVFDEEFNGTALDGSRWATCYFWSSTTCTNATTKELELYQPENVTVGGGKLRLTAREQSASDTQKQYSYTSGMISGLSSSATLFSFKYGYVDARARLPAGQGLWSAFWMLPIDRTSLPEIDIFEVYGQHPNVDNTTTHWQAGGQSLQQGHMTQGPDLSAGWHDFGLEWDSSRLVWYLDGKEIWRVTGGDAIPRTDMYLLGDLAVGGSFGGPPNADTTFPSSLLIDSVRVWQHG